MGDIDVCVVDVCVVDVCVVDDVETIAKKSVNPTRALY